MGSSEDVFAKDFVSDEHGQIVVIKGQDDDGQPSLEVYGQPPGLGTSSIEYGYEDNDKGWDERDKDFEKLDREKAQKLVQPMFDQAEAIFGKQIEEEEKETA